MMEETASSDGDVDHLKGIVKIWERPRGEGEQGEVERLGCIEWASEDMNNEEALNRSTQCNG